MALILHDDADVMSLLEARKPPAVTASTVSTIAIVLFPIRIFLGMGWLRAGVEKLIDPRWWGGDGLAAFLAEQRELALPFMAGVSDRLFEPFTMPISLVVMLGQLAVAVGLVTTRLLRPALWAGITMNAVFVAMGAVNPSVFYLVIEVTLLAALNNGLLGDDRRRPRPSNAGIKAGLGLALLPYVETVHPADVIDDPAIILSTVLFLAAATDGLALLAAPERTGAAPLT